MLTLSGTELEECRGPVLVLIMVQGVCIYNPMEMLLELQ